MSSDDDDTEKQHDPSQRKLEDARKRGEIPTSAELITAAGYLGLLLAAMVAGGNAIRQVGTASMVLLEQSPKLADRFFAQGNANVGGLIAAFVVPLLPLFLAPMLAGILGIVAQRAMVFTPEKIAPRLSRISPLATAKQKFGLDGLFGFGKSVMKLSVVCLTLAIYLPSRAGEILSSLNTTPAQSSVTMMSMLLDFLALAFLSTLVFGGFDYGWQHFQHVRRNRMSRKDLIDEAKDSEGDPHVKAQRRQRGQEIALNKMLREVATADVVLVNPTHFAVALKWKRTDRSAPICVAKGTDEIAARIRARAAEAGVPIHRDAPTARAIFASVEIGAPIRAEHYRAVAAAIRFSEAMRKRARPKST